MTRFTLIRSSVAALALVLPVSVTADGISNPTTQFVGNMGEGASNSSAAGGAAGNCAQTGLIFTSSCNAILYVVLF